MLAARVLTRVSRSVGGRSLLLSAPKQFQSPTLSDHFHSRVNESLIKLVPNELSLLHRLSVDSSTFQRLGFSSSASAEPSEKEEGGAKVSDETKGAASGELDGADRLEESESEIDGDLSMEEMVKLVAERDELLKVKQKELVEMKDKLVRTLAEMENVMARTRRDAENSKKFSIQNFAKSLLDVADNLGRASTHVKDSFSKIDESEDTVGAVPLLKTLLEGVEMTEKQLAGVFRKFGVEKFDPINEPFDPNRHNAAFQVPDNSKPPGTVAHVLKAGYMLYDRVIRPADVGVTQAPEEN